MIDSSPRSSIRNDLRMANLDAAPMMDATMDRVIPVAQPLLSLSLLLPANFARVAVVVVVAILVSEENDAARTLPSRCHSRFRNKS